MSLATKISKFSVVLGKVSQPINTEGFDLDLMTTFMTKSYESKFK